MTDLSARTIRHTKSAGLQAPAVPLAEQARLNQGLQALQKRDFAAVGQICQDLLRRHPQMKEAHFLVGLAAAEQRQWGLAQQAFKTVVSIDRQDWAAWAQLARSFALTGQYDNCKTALDQIKEPERCDAFTADTLSTVCSLMGRVDEALVWSNIAVKQVADAPHFLLNRARSLIFLGKLNEARRDLDSALALKPGLAEAHWLIASLERATSTQHISAMQAALKQTPPESAAFLYYATGKEHEDLGHWDEAAKAYSAGARLKRRTVPYDEAGEDALFSTLMETFDAPWLKAQEGKGYKDCAPIFILGQPRTGTTLVERIFAAHPEAVSAGELQQFSQAIKALASALNAGRPNTDSLHKGQPDAAGSNAAHSFAGLAGLGGMSVGALRAVAGLADVGVLGQRYAHTTKLFQGQASRFIDKMPVNYLYAPLIAAALPNATLVHVSRDPMDSCFASYKQLFADAYFHSYSLEEMARHHVRYRKLMDRWHALLGDRLIQIQYEDLVSNFEAGAKALIQHAGLAWAPECLEFYRGGAVTTASAVQVREKAHTRSVGKWRKFAQHLKPMQDILEKHGLLTQEGNIS